MSEVSYSDLRCHFQTGRSYVISGTGRNRIYGYRNGVQCNLGDLDRPEWCNLVHDVIHRECELELYHQLLQHLKDHNYARESNAQLEFKALELHAARIFDNPDWVDFLEFNRKYRPEVAASTRLILILPACCQKPGHITGSRYDKNQSENFCPLCGCWTKISLAEERTYV